MLRPIARLIQLEIIEMKSFTFRSNAGHLVTVKAKDESTARSKAMIKLHGPAEPFGLGPKRANTSDENRGFACYPEEWRGEGLGMMPGQNQGE